MDGRLQLLDQTRLPAEEIWLDCPGPEEVAGAIKRLSVRGAPAIGVAAAYGLAVAVGRDGVQSFEQAWQLLASTRPTAVNLRWALDQGRELFESQRLEVGDDAEALASALFAWADRLHREDVETNRSIGRHGAELFKAGDRVLTHCNAWSARYRRLWHRGRRDSGLILRRAGWLVSGSTRPVRSYRERVSPPGNWRASRSPTGSSPTPSAGALLARGHVDRIVVGADRIAANGDTANKIGTYPVAVLAQRHGVPFYVAAPLSTIDAGSENGDVIPIEERSEARGDGGTRNRGCPHREHPPSTLLSTSRRRSWLPRSSRRSACSKRPTKIRSQRRWPAAGGL